MKRLQGKVAIVTGSKRGIGKGIALAFGREGCSVVVSDHTEDSEAKGMVDEIKKMGSEAIFVKADVSKEKDIKRLVEKAVKRFRKLDIMVNNAGIFTFGTADAITEKEWDKIMDVNLKGFFCGTKYAAKQMLKQRKGRIINISSIAGIVGFAGASAYCASKGGVTEFTREAALDYAKHGITVNAINPGVIQTKMTKALIEDKAMRKQFLEYSHGGRIGMHEDIGNAAVFLALDESGFITGHNLVVDGGWTAK